MPILIALYILWGVLLRTSLNSPVPEAPVPEDISSPQD